jgi:outer membrane scaffolding protein for murein synthesis (MipA/OmpV family)
MFASTSISAEAGKCDVVELLQCESVKPLPEEGVWTFGAGVGMAQGIPRYIGAKETYSFLLPFPYITYRSPKLTINRSGVTGRLFNSEKVLLSVSLSGAFPVDSSDIAIRTGMPDIAGSFEVGPSLQYYILGDEFARNALFAEMNIRSVQTIEFTHLDFASGPKLSARARLVDDILGGSLNWSGQIRWEFVSRSYANYMYGVPEAYETNERSRYMSGGGYAGYRVGQSLNWRKNQWMANSFVGYANISGAVFADSPLVLEQSHLYWGLSVIKIF